MRKKVNKKLIVALLSFVLLFGGTFGSSLAWLLDTSEDVNNVFTTSDITADLKETTTDYKMIPGHTIAKDPKATVTDGSEDAYLFVKVTEEGVTFVRDGETMPSEYSFSDFLTYEIDEGWTKLEEGVYYRIFNSNDSTSSQKGTYYSILENDSVTVLETVTKEMMNDLVTHEVNPKLSFTAYAVQLYKNNTEKFTPTEAWELACDLD